MYAVQHPSSIASVAASSSEKTWTSASGTCQMPHVGCSCAQARSPASMYCGARSSQCARFLVTCSGSSLMATPRSFGPNQYELGASLSPCKIIWLNGSQGRYDNPRELCPVFRSTIQPVSTNVYREGRAAVVSLRLFFRLRSEKNRTPRRKYSPSSPRPHAGSLLTRQPVPHQI